jgi:flagellar biosynthesis protein
MTGQKELAIALRYTEALPAPLVVASGRGAVARAIARIAAESGVPRVEDPQLAASMITLDAGSLIPESLYEAIAALLAFVRDLETEQ